MDRKKVDRYKQNPDIQCKHHTREGYHYLISKGQRLWLCFDCELNLRKAMFDQIIHETEFDLLRVNHK